MLPQEQVQLRIKLFSKAQKHKMLMGILEQYFEYQVLMAPQCLTLRLVIQNLEAFNHLEMGVYFNLIISPTQGSFSVKQFSHPYNLKEMGVLCMGLQLLRM